MPKNKPHPFLGHGYTPQQARMLEALLESTNSHFAVYDSVGRYLYASPKCAASLGFVPAQMLGKTGWELGIPPELARHFQEKREQVFATGETVQGKLSYELVQGMRDIEYTFSPLFDDQGRVEVVLGVSQDCTEQNQAEQILKAQSALAEGQQKGLRAVMAAAHILLGCPDIDSLYRSAVELAREKLGLERCSLYVVDETGQFVFGTYGTDNQGQTADERSFRFPITGFWTNLLAPLKPGERFWVSFPSAHTYWNGTETIFIGEGWVVCTPIFTHGGTLGLLFNDTALSRKPVDELQHETLAVYASLLGSLLERKRAEEAHRQLAVIVETSQDAILSQTLDGIILSWNQGAERLFGYTRSEIIGQSTLRFVPPEHMEQRLPLIERIRRGETLEPVETVRLHKDGRRIDVFLRVSPIRDAAGEVVAASVIARDVTDRKRLEAQLLQSQKMEGIGRLAGGIAHDFNNLLAVIMGYAEMVEMELDPQSDLLPNVHNIQSAANRAATLTKQLLTFARRQVIEAKVFQFNELLRGMGQMLTPLIGEHIALSLHLEAALGLVKADPNQIEQVVVNLVVNARDAMPHGGQLRIETRSIELTDHDMQRDIAVVPGRYALLTVSDTGAGMTPEVKLRLFEPFFTTKGVGKGTGLGLATCYGIVKQNKGYIWIYSEVGQGTTVKVYLPCVEEAVSVEKPVTPDETILQGTETILVVEDEPLVRSLAVTTLRANGYTVIEAENGLDGLRVAAEYEHPIDLLLTDVIMPMMGGVELAENLRDARPGLHILYASGYTEDAFEAQGTPPDDILLLSKPFSSRVLLQKVRAALAQ